MFALNNIINSSCVQAWGVYYLLVWYDYWSNESNFYNDYYFVQNIYVLFTTTCVLYINNKTPTFSIVCINCVPRRWKHNIYWWSLISWYTYYIISIVSYDLCVWGIDNANDVVVGRITERFFMHVGKCLVVWCDDVLGSIWLNATVSDHQIRYGECV